MTAIRAHRRFFFVAALLASGLMAAGESAEAKAKLGALGLAPNVFCGADYAPVLRRQFEQLGTAIRASSIKVE